MKNNDTESNDENSDLALRNKSKVLGPSLPPGFNKFASNETSCVENKIEPSDSFGPKLPPHMIKTKINGISTSQTSTNEDDNIIGPSPNSSSETALEERARLLRYKFLTQNNEDEGSVSKRESWMVELPPENAAHLGLGPRKFKTSNTGNKSNRSAWTETPQNKDKQNNTEDVDYFETAAVSQRNKVMDEIVKKSKHKKEKKSLLEVHEKKMKKKKDKKHNKSERRPFDRDVDLQVNRFDESVKKSIIKKAQLLDSRFAAGKSKYL